MEKLKNGLTAITVGEIIEKCFDKLDAINEREFEYRSQGKKDGNAANERARVGFILDRLVNVPEDVVFELEGCRGDYKDFFPNAGSVIECAVKYFATGRKFNRISKSELYSKDMTMGCIDWEIKASVSPAHLSTPSKDELTLLVNRDGAYLIRKADTLKYVNKNGRLPFHGTHIKAYKPEWLNKALGYAEA